MENIKFNLHLGGVLHTQKKKPNPREILAEDHIVNVPLI